MTRTIEADHDMQLRGLSTEQREDLMIRAAKLYYDLDRTQNQIGRDLGLNRFQVSRLLREARDRGIIRIEIAARTNRKPDLESRLQRCFALKDSVVVGGHQDESGSMLNQVAGAAASYLAAMRPNPRLVGVSWGRTMSAVAERLPQGWSEGVEVVLLNGATHLQSTSAPTNAVAERFAAAGHGVAALLPVPAIIGQAGTARALEADPIVARVLALGAAAPIACFGMGGIVANSVLVESGYIDAETMLGLRSKGAVGDILGRVIDQEGCIVDPELDRRTIGLALEALREKTLSIGISAGPAKHAVALAAIRARYINVLITDETTARYLLENADAQ